MIKYWTGVTKKEAVFVQEPASVISTFKEIQGHLQTTAFFLNSPEDDQQLHKV